MSAALTHNQPQKSDCMPQINLRPMQEKDIPQVFEIDRLSFALPWSERSYRFDLTQNSCARMWVAECSHPDGIQQIIGMIVLWLVIDEAHIGTIAIHPDYRQQGIGRMLLHKALHDARSAGMTRAFLEVRRSNLTAQNLYQSFGFEVTGVRSKYYQDNQEDAIMMTLDETTGS